MTVAESDIAAGIAAAEAYEGWEAGFVGADHNREMVVILLNAAGASSDQSLAGRRSAAVIALNAAITAAGKSGSVPDGMIAGVTAAVINK